MRFDSGSPLAGTGGCTMESILCAPSKIIQRKGRKHVKMISRRAMKNPGDHGLLAMSSDLGSLNLQRLTPAWCKPLAHMLRELRESGDDRTFAPHPFDDETLARLASHTGQDLYFVLAEGERVIGYGLLRGWDQGYEVPSIGIAVAPVARSRGVGRHLMERLHQAARERGARRVRLRVHPDNAPAIRLYETLGYVMDAVARENGLVVGVLELG